MTKCILSEPNAIEYCLKYLKTHKKYIWRGLNYINNNRYCLVSGDPKIAIVLKRAWFENYGNMNFINEANGLKETGIGDSLNVEDLKKFHSFGVKEIYIVYQDGKIYQISLIDFLLYSFRWVNKEGKEVRSISIHRYLRVNPDNVNLAYPYNGE